MADVKISALTAAAAVAAADQFPIVQGGVTKVADGTMAMVRTGGLKDNVVEVATILKLSGVENTITAHAGGTQADAFALSATKSIHNVTVVGTDADSVKLPAATGSGVVHWIKNSDAAQSLQLFAADTETIDGVASATGVAIAAGKSRICVDFAAGLWLSIYGA